MSRRTDSIVTFEAEKVIEPFYTGGSLALSRDGRVLATCLGEQVLLTDLGTGERLARIEGVSRLVPWKIRMLTHVPGWRSSN